MLCIICVGLECYHLRSSDGYTTCVFGWRWARINFVLVGLAPRGLDVCRFAGTQVNMVTGFPVAYVDGPPANIHGVNPLSGTYLPLI